MFKLCLALLAVCVGTSANPVVQPLVVSCEERLTSIVDDPNQFCAQLREAYSIVNGAIKDVEKTISESSVEAVEDFSGILESTVRYLKQRLPSFLPVRITRDSENREAQDYYREFQDLITDAADAAVAADLAASEQIRQAILEAVAELHQKEDLISQGAQRLLKNMMQKRSAQGAELQQALDKVDRQLKIEISKALQVCLKEFQSIMSYMEQKLKLLLAGKVQVDFDTNVQAVAKLSQEALDQIVERYDSSAKTSINDAIIKIHDLLMAVEKIGQNKPEAIKVLGQVMLAMSGKSSGSGEGKPKFADVRAAFSKAAQAMEDDYKEIAALVGKQ